MQQNNKNRNTITFWLLFGFAFVLFLLFIPEESHNGDIGHWKRWTAFIILEGLPYIYDLGTHYSNNFPCNYPPVLLYMFDVYGMIIPDLDFLSTNFKYFKVIPLVFDFIGAGIIFLLIKRNFKTSFLPLLLLLSPAYMYNSYCWGQVDSIFTAFIALSLIFGLKRKWKLAILFYIIALNTKMQAIVFMPVVILTLIPVIDSWKKIGWSVFIAGFTQVIILSPFILHGTVGDWYSVMSSLVDQYPNVSLNAFNIWHLLMETSTVLPTKDYELFWFGMTYKNWGLLFFFAFSFIALLPLFLQAIHFAIQKVQTDQNFKSLVFLSAFLCVLGFFFFNTQMHERYSHPALLLAFLFGVLSKKYWLYGLTSIAYFLNMERTLRFFDISYGTFIFLKPFIASLFLLTLLVGLWHLYTSYPIVKNWTAIRDALRIKIRLLLNNSLYNKTK